MTRVSAAIVALVAIGCVPDVHVNPAAARVENPQQPSSSHRRRQGVFRSAADHVSVGDARRLSMPTKYAAIAAVTYPKTANA